MKNKIPFAPLLSGFHVPVDRPLVEFANEPHLPLYFPCKVILTLANGDHVEFAQGEHGVPVSLLDNWYLKANGVVTVEEKNKIDAQNKKPRMPAAVAQGAQEPIFIHTR